MKRLLSSMFVALAFFLAHCCFYFDCVIWPMMKNIFSVGLVPPFLFIIIQVLKNKHLNFKSTHHGLNVLLMVGSELTSGPVVS